jgi:hypothetical protein
MLGETNTPPSLGYNDYFLQTNALMQFTPPSWKLPYNTKQAQSAYAPICSRLVLSTFGLRPPVHSVCVAKPVTCCAAVTGNCSLNHFNCSLNHVNCSLNHVNCSLNQDLRVADFDFPKQIGEENSTSTLRLERSNYTR